MKATKIALLIAIFSIMAGLCVVGPAAEPSGNLQNPTLRLTRTGFHRAILDRGNPVRGLSISTGDVPDNVLAIRVDFPEDTTSSTTGTGKFDLSTGSSETINPPPHDLTYFQRQMRALRQYYLNVSRGRLDMSYAVFPEEHDSAYTVSHQMAYYYPTSPMRKMTVGWRSSFGMPWRRPMPPAPSIFRNSMLWSSFTPESGRTSPSQ